LKVVVIFEGRDSSGKGGAIKRIVEHLDPRICRVVAMNAPTRKQESQLCGIQRYVQHLPAEGEMVLFDRSWYCRSGVESVMGFATDEEVCPPVQHPPQFGFGCDSVSFCYAGAIRFPLCVLLSWPAFCVYSSFPPAFCVYGSVALMCVNFVVPWCTLLFPLAISSLSAG
jgi:hypothetical protein